MKIEAREEHVIILADLNRHLPCLKEMNHGKVSACGQIVEEFIDSNDYILLNNTPLMQNAYTRSDPSDPEND